jgi:uncharacterized protein YecT (DUF1311 family)
MRKLKRLILAGLLAAVPIAATAADISWAPPITNNFVVPFPVANIGEGLQPEDIFNFGNHLHIRIDGRIEKGDAEKFSALVGEKREEIFDSISGGVNLIDVVVSLNSDGGSLYEGLKLSDSIRGFATYVAKGDRCLSACALAFLGGRVRMLRGYPEWPARYIHAGATVGFHAPFSSLSNNIMIPDGISFSSTLGKQIANQFYAQAQDAINEITRRMEGWGLSADFVFEMIGKKYREKDDRPLSEQFLLINTYRRLEQTKTILVADQVLTPHEIGVIGAYNACNFVITAKTGRFWLSGLPMDSAEYGLSGPIGTRPVAKVVDRKAVEYGNLVTSGGPAPVMRTHLASMHDLQMLLPPDGDDTFYFEGQVPGPGRMDCTVFKSQDGAWYVQSYSPSLRQANTYVAVDGYSTETRDLLDNSHPFKVNDYTILGPDGVWNNFPAVPTPEQLVPLFARFPDVMGPSFDCSGTLDPSAEVICKEGFLARMDGVLGKVYRQALSRGGNELRAAQRHWLKARDRACRPGGVDSKSVLQHYIAIQCLAYFYSIRLTELDEAIASQ